jgi:hypothetical protein
MATPTKRRTNRSLFCYFVSAMSKIISIGLLLLLLSSVVGASPLCPITIVSGSGGGDGFSVSFWNSGKLPIRRLEFSCTPLRGELRKAHLHPCREDNALFFPGSKYTVEYPYPDGVPRPLLLSVKSVTLSDGYVWIPHKQQTCHTVIKVYLSNAKK